MRTAVAIIILLFAFGCGVDASHGADSRRDVQLFDGAAVPCTRAAQQASSRAQELERVAAARWERVPFATNEAAGALSALAEAESCYTLARESSGAQRTQHKRKQFEQEITRRFARARLQLDVAARTGQLQQARHQVAEMIALLGGSGDAAYREELLRLERRYAARLAEQRKVQ